MVIAPANTGKDNNKRIVVTNTAQAKRGIRSKNIPITRKLLKVLIKLTAPKSEETPARCREKIAKSTDAPECAMFLLRGGYTVQPVPAPDSTKALEINSNKEGMRNQNLILFNRGKAMSGAPNISGTSQLPNPPIRTGITIKKIIINA